MISVLLVGNEKSKMDREGFELRKEPFVKRIFTAGSREEAVEVFFRERPELVFIELELSGKDGLKVAEQIYAEDPHTKLIFFSKEKSYEKLKTALQLHVEGYYAEGELSREEWKKMLSEIVRKTDNQKVLRECVMQCQISHYFLGKIHPGRQMLSYLFPRKLDFMVLEQDHILLAAERMAENPGKPADEQLVMQLIQEQGEIVGLAYLTPYRYLCFYESGGDLNQRGSCLKKTLWEATGESFSVFFICRQADMECCKSEYQNKQWLFDKRYFEGKSVVLDAFFYEQPKTVKKISSLEKFESYLEQGWEEACLEEFSRLFSCAIKEKDYEIFSKLTEQVLDIFYQYDKKLFNIREKQVFTLGESKIEDFFTARGMVCWMRKKCEEILEYKKEEQKMRCSRHVDYAVRYIIKEYGKPDLSIEDIAAYVGMGVNRLNDLFKAEIGETVGHFLTRVRMEKAKQLLEDGMRVKELSSQIGYYSSSYFSKVFKKTYLLSPKEYQQEIKFGNISLKS